MSKNLFDSICNVTEISEEAANSFLGDNGDSKTTSLNRESGDKPPDSTPNVESTMSLFSKSDETCVPCNKDTEKVTDISSERQNLTDDQKANDGIAPVPAFNSSMNIWSRLGVESSEFESRSPVFALNSEMPQLVGYNTTEEVTNDRTPPHLSPHIASSAEETDSGRFFMPNPLSNDEQLEKDKTSPSSLTDDASIRVLDSASVTRSTKDSGQSQSDKICPLISSMTFECFKKGSDEGEKSTEKTTLLEPPTLSPNDSVAYEQDAFNLQTKRNHLPNKNDDDSSSIQTKLDESKEIESSTSDVQIIDDPSSIDNTFDQTSTYKTHGEKSTSEGSSAQNSSKMVSCDSFAKQQSSNSTSTRHVSFFEKAADFFGTNLIDAGDISLSSTNKRSVFSALVSDGDVLMQSSNPVNELHTKSPTPCQSQLNTDAKKNEKSSSKVNPLLSSRPSDFLFESCSVNELLMKEEEEEEGKDVSEEASEESGLLDPEVSPESTTKSYLNKVVDMVMPSTAGSQLQTISSRLRTRMPHWDDAFNDAFVPQLRGKSISSASPGSVHSHTSDLSSKRLKHVQISGDSKPHDDDTSSLTVTYRDSSGPVPLHVKKARHYLFNLDVMPQSNQDSDSPCENNSENGDDSEFAAKKLTRGDPVSKYNASLASKKLTYHEFKKAIRMPPILVRNLTTPVVGKVEGVKQPGNAPPPVLATAAPLPASPLPGSAVEFRSSLGAMVRTKARAFTKAALRRQIAEEASTARPHFRVKSRAGPEGGARSLALVITRVTRPPMKRSLSQSKAGEEEETPAPASAAISTTTEAAAGVPKMTTEQAANESPPKCLKEAVAMEDQPVFLSDPLNTSSGERAFDDVDEDDATTPAMSQTTDGGGASTPDIAPMLSTADGESPTATETTEMRNEDDVTEPNKSRPADHTSNRTPVNFRGVASNRKRLKKKTNKPRLLAEIENTTGFIMEQNSGNVREQRALQRVLHNLSASEAAPSRVARAKRKAKAALHSKHKSRWRKAVGKGKREAGRFRRPQDDSRAARSEIKNVTREAKSPKNLPKEKRRASPRNLAAASRISAKYMRSRDARNQPGPPAATTEMATARSGSNSLNALHREVLAVMLLPYRRDHYGRGPLHMAAELGHMESIHFCLNSADETLSNVLSKDFMGLTPLHAAARSDMWSAVIALLDAGADVNAKGGAQNETPLHEAAANGSYQSALILLSRGADRSLRSSDGKTAVDVAKHLEMRELIRKYEEHSKKKFAERLSVLPAVSKEFVFELCDLNFPLIFEVWLENRWKEMVMVCEMAEIMCTTIRAILTRFASKIITVKLTLGDLKKSLRSQEMWPAIRFKVMHYFHDSMSRLDNWKDRSLTLAVYSPAIRDLLGGLSFTVAQEEVDAEQEVEQVPPLPRLLTKKEKVERKLARHYQAECEYEYDLKRELQGRGLISPPQARISNVMTAVAPKMKEKMPSPKEEEVPTQTIEASSSSTDSGEESDDDVVITGIFTSSAPKRQRTSVSEPVTEPPPPPPPPPAPPLPRPPQSGSDRAAAAMEREKLPAARRRPAVEEEYLKKCQLKINSARRELELYEERVSKALSAIRCGEKSDTTFEKAQKVSYPSVDLADDDVELEIVDHSAAPEPSTSVARASTDTAFKRLRNAASIPSAIFDHDYSQAPPRPSPGTTRAAPPRSVAPILSLNASSRLATPVTKPIPPSELQHSGVPVRTVRVARSSLLPSAVPSPTVRELPVSSQFLVTNSNQVQHPPARSHFISGPPISRSATRLIPGLTQGISLPFIPKSTGPSSPNRSPPVLLAQTVPTEQLRASVTPDPIAPPVLFPQPPVLQPDPQIVDCLSDSEFYGDVLELDADCPPPPLMPCLGVDAPTLTSNATSKLNVGFGVPVVDGVKLSQSQTHSVFTSAIKVPTSTSILNRNTCFILQSNPKAINVQRKTQSLAPPILIPEQFLDSKGLAEQTLAKAHRRPSFGNPPSASQGHKRFDLSLQLKPSQAKPASALLSAAKAKKCLSQPPSPAAKVTTIPVTRKPTKRVQAVFNSDSQSAKIQRLSQSGSSPDRIPSISTKQVKVFQSCREDDNNMKAVPGESPTPLENSKTLFHKCGVVPSSLPNYQAGEPATSSSAPQKPQPKPSEIDFRIDLTELSSPEAS